MSLSTLTAALREHFGVLVADVEGLVVAWPNAPVDPPTDAQWLSVAVLPGEFRRVELGPGGLSRTRGVLLVGVYSPAASGTEAMWELVDRVNEALRTTSTTAGFPAGFTVEEPVPGPRRRDGAHWRVDVQCPFSADEAPPP